MKNLLTILILGYCFSASAQNVSPLFFSEYGEGSANNKYIEIYNSSSESVSLANYALARVDNGTSVYGVHEFWSDIFPNSASILPRGVYVVAHPSANPDILAIADVTFGSLPNGDDGLALVMGTQSEYTYVDFVGDFNGDPGTGWPVCDDSNGTRDQTLVRKCQVTSGAEWSVSSAAATCQWEIYPKDTWDNLGFHCAIGDDCSVSFTYNNTGVNASIFINENAGGLLNVGDSIGVFYMAADGTTQCAGASTWLGTTTQIVAFGDDATTPEKDGLAPGDTYFFIARSGDNFYQIDAIYTSPSMASHTINGISLINSISFSEFSCEVDTVEGCTDSNANNYSTNANTDDGSCLYSGCTDSNADNYNSTATDDDGSCIYYGCIDFNADNYDPLSNSDDGSCIYLGCTNSDYLEYWNYNWVSSDGLTYYYLLTPLNELVNQDDGSCNTQIVQGCVDPNFMEYNPQSNIFDMDLCQTIIVRGCMDETAFNFSIIANTDDGSCYPVIEGCMDQSAFNYVQPTGDVLVDINTNNNEMCVPVIYGCLDSLAYNFNDYDGDGEYNELTGIPTVDVNTDDGSCIERVYGCLDNDYVEYNVLANTDNGSCDVLLSVAYTEVTQQNINLNNTIEEASTSLSSLQQALDTWNTTIDLSAGWNMFGYGCPSSIDVAEGLSNHTENIIITKDNNGNVYMPEFGFNGIGDFTPGYGYQIKLTEAIDSFSLCDWYVNDIPEDNIVSLQEENTSLVDSILLLNNNIVSLQQVIGNIDEENQNLANQYQFLSFQIGCTDSLACNFDINKLYDDGSCEYPEENFDCNGFIIAELGDIMEGGYLFYIDETGKHGLVVAMTDIIGYWWGCWDINIPGSEGSAIGDGLQNTLNIVAVCSDEPNAASEALAYEFGGYNDWYLPSIGELYEIYNTIGNGDLNDNIYGFGLNNHSVYWSSTQSHTPAAITINFDDGSSTNVSKANTNLYFRPIRSF